MPAVQVTPASLLSDEDEDDAVLLRFFNADGEKQGVGQFDAMVGELDVDMAPPVVFAVWSSVWIDSRASVVVTSPSTTVGRSGEGASSNAGRSLVTEPTLVQLTVAVAAGWWCLRASELL